MNGSRYVVLGAGISGLALAYLLATRRPGAQVTVLEQATRTGGWVDSREKEGFLFEMGPRSLRTRGKGAYTLQLAEELGLASEVIAADPAARIRYLYRGGRLCALPHSLGSFLFSPYLPLAVRAALRDWRVPPGEREDESVHAFIERHFGTDVADGLIDPLTLGIFARDSRTLSVQACFPLWAEMERSHGSLLRAAWQRKKQPLPTSPWIAAVQKQPLFSFRNGMETLTRTLTERLGGAIRVGTSAVALHAQPDGIEVEIAGGRRLSADHVFSTLPATALGKLLNISDFGIANTSVALVAAGWRGKQLLKQKGFGYLVPTAEAENVLGVVWDSSAFPQQNRSNEETRLTVMIDAQEGKDFQGIALEALARHLHIDRQPDTVEVKVAQNAIPHYRVGHTRQAAALADHCRALSPHLTLIGTAFDGVAVNDCVAKAYSFVDR